MPAFSRSRFCDALQDQLANSVPSDVALALLGDQDLRAVLLDLRGCLEQGLGRIEGAYASQVDGARAQLGRDLGERRARVLEMAGSRRDQLAGPLDRAISTALLVARSIA